MSNDQRFATPGDYSAAVASKESVLEAARKLLTKHGYAGLSMRELARESGLAKSTIYHHFQDKHDIYFHVLARDIQLVREQIAAVCMMEASWDDRLRSVVGTYFELQAARRGIVLSALRDGFGNEAQFCDLAKRYRDELIQPLAALLNEGIHMGHIRAMNVEMAVISLLGIMHSFMAHRLLLESSNTGPEIVDFTLQLFLHGIARHGADIDSLSTIW